MAPLLTFFEGLADLSALLYQLPLIRSAGLDYKPCEMGDISHCISAPHGTVTLIKKKINYRAQNTFSAPMEAGDRWPKGADIPLSVNNSNHFPGLIYPFWG